MMQNTVIVTSMPDSEEYTVLARNFAHFLYGLLQGSGYMCKELNEAMLPGQQVKLVLSKIAREAPKVVLFIFPGERNYRGHVRAMIRDVISYSSETSRALIPVILPGAKLPGELEHIYAIDLRDPYTQNEELLKLLKVILTDLGVTPKQSHATQAQNLLV